MKICAITDMDIRGSGYKNLMSPLLQGLQTTGHDVKVIGLSYKNEQHDFAFGILPAQNLMDVIRTAELLYNSWQFDICIVGIDINHHEKILQSFKDRPFKYIGIMPIEAPPLSMSWAMILAQMDKVFTISEFGAQECYKRGIDAEHLQIGLDLDAWKAPTDDERKKLREVQGVSDTFVILTIADNQERKNLSRAMEIVADFIYKYDGVNAQIIQEKKLKPVRDVQYNLVTREHFWGGWNLRDYAQDLGISLHLNIYERGIPFEQLWGLYAVANAFLLTSKAEGLGMPIMEAQAMKVPVAATNFTGMAEQLHGGDYGYPIAYYDYPEFDPYTDPFGNGLRVFAKRSDGKARLEQIAYDDPSDVVQKAHSFVSQKTHQISIAQLEKAINDCCHSQN